MSKASWLAVIFILTATPSFADRYISGNDLDDAAQKIVKAVREQAR